MVAVGYDDNHRVLNADGEPSDNDDQQGESFTKGALLIRNCWGTEWGEHGYGWLPYAYVQQGLTSDWWSLVKAEWLNTAQFGFGSNLNFRTTLPDQIFSTSLPDQIY